MLASLQYINCARTQAQLPPDAWSGLDLDDYVQELHQELRQPHEMRADVRAWPEARLPPSLERAYLREGRRPTFSTFPVQSLCAVTAQGGLPGRNAACTCIEEEPDTYKVTCIKSSHAPIFYRHAEFCADENTCVCEKRDGTLLGSGMASSLRAYLQRHEMRLELGASVHPERA
ncbi:MAG: hypothetical protein M1825_004643 [Sarcosagium campestre]|nr:MAG: hypothetical protein M1825_004643 [Sarcosagium campestre]